MVERHDGVLVLFMRNQQSPRGRERRHESHDAHLGPIRFDEALPEIWCQPNVISLPSPEGEDRIAFANARSCSRFEAAESFT